MTGLSLVNSESKSLSLKPCGCSEVRLQLHEIDHIDHADLELRQMLAQDRNRRQRLERRHIAGAGHDHVRLAVLIVAGPLPDADALGAMLDGRIHRSATAAPDACPPPPR